MTYRAAARIDSPSKIAPITQLRRSALSLRVISIFLQVTGQTESDNSAYGNPCDRL